MKNRSVDELTPGIDISCKMEAQQGNVHRSSARSKNVALIAVFSSILGILAISAWIVPLGHITMEFLINTVVIVLLKMRRAPGTLLMAGIVTGIIDFLGGLSGPGGFLSPVVYGFRFGFLELVYSRLWKYPSRHENVRIVVMNSVGYFLTSTFIWLLYAAFFLPLGDEFTQRMWFAFAVAGTIVSIPATALAIKIHGRWLSPHVASIGNESR